MLGIVGKEGDCTSGLIVTFIITIQHHHHHGHHHHKHHHHGPHHQHGHYAILTNIMILVITTTTRTEQKCYKPNEPGLCRQGRWFVAVRRNHRHNHHHNDVFCQLFKKGNSHLIRNYFQILQTLSTFYLENFENTIFKFCKHYF